MMVLEAGRMTVGAEPRERKAPGVRFDAVLVTATAALASLGVVLVYSASSVFAAKVYGDAEHFLVQQAAWTAVGVGALVLVARVPAERLARLAPWLLVATMALCAAVLVPGVGKLVNGATRRLVVGPVGFQPSELCKLAIVLAFARVLARRDQKPEHDRASLLPPVLMLQLPVLLILVEPDLGTALVIELIVAVMVFAAGVRLRTIALLGLAALPIVYHLVVGTPFRLQRLLSYIDPWAYRSTVGYQITESLISIGSGGALGVGLGSGKHKLFFLPEAHTDFIFSILGEELGLVGVVLVLLAFGAFVWRGLRIAARARNAYESYLALGLTALVGVPALFNAGVATGLLPTKGLSLPFVSYGGSNLVVTFMAVGMLLRIAGEQGGGARAAAHQKAGGPTREHAVEGAA